MKSLMVGTIAVLCSVSNVHAQTSVVWAAPTAGVETGRRSYFPVGTPLALVTRTELSTKQNKPGDRFYLEVAESLSYNGQIVVPVGSIAVGEVTRAERNGHFGKKGKMDVRLLYVETPSGPIRLQGRAADTGKSGLILAAAGVALVTPLAFFIHGTSARLAAGTPITAQLADDLTFAVRDMSMQPAVAIATPVRSGALPARFDPSVFSARN